MNLVVDSASIEVNRRKRRLKTDRIDALKLLAMIIRYHNGERTVYSVVHVPSPEAEDARHLHRELLTVKADRTRVTNRIKGSSPHRASALPHWAGTSPERYWICALFDGAPLCPQLTERLEREWQHRSELSQRIGLIERRQLTLLRTQPDEPALELVRQLMTLKGIGLQSAWLFTFEFFAWRNIQNRRQLAALAGLTPTAYQSGGQARDQGISKAGNSLVRAMTVQIAWGWLRFQPDSELTLFFERRFAHAGRRMRAVGIVAVARGS